MTYLFPAQGSNAITKEYYYLIKNQENKRTIKQKAIAIRHTNARGEYLHTTYHLITTR